MSEQEFEKYLDFALSDTVLVTNIATRILIAGKQKAINRARHKMKADKLKAKAAGAS